MTKNIFLSTIGMMAFLAWGINSMAETTIRDELLPYMDQNPILIAEEFAEKSNSIEEKENAFLEYLLGIPFEQRQYVFPALFDVQNVPKKITTHPEIAIWKGKMPTDIDPEQRAFADKYLKDINPIFYIYLAPKGPKNETDMPIPNNGISLFSNTAPKIVKSPATYPTIKEVLKQPENLRKNPDLAVLKPEDISKIETGVELLGKYIEDQIRDYPQRWRQYQLLSTYYTDPDKERINPFQAKVERLALMKRIKKLEQELQKAGFASAEEFAVKTDAMVKAYRAANMSYAVAVQARRYKAVTPQNKTEKILVMGAKMYEAYPKDVQLVRDNLEDVREIFIKNGFQSVLNAETFDAVRK